MIVPVRDGARFLAEALGSIARQDYGRVETIIIDDGSTDESVEIAREFVSDVVVHETTLGVAATRNEGVRRASGEILAFIDQDDVWESAAISTHVAAMRDARLAVSAIHEMIFLEAGVDRPAWLRPELIGASHPALVPSGIAMTRATFESVGPFDETFVHGSDSDWLARARSAGIPFVISPVVLLRRRIHTANASHDPWASSEVNRFVRATLRRKRQSAEGA